MSFWKWRFVRKYFKRFFQWRETRKTILSQTKALGFLLLFLFCFCTWLAYASPGSNKTPLKGKTKLICFQDSLIHPRVVSNFGIADYLELASTSWVLGFFSSLDARLVTHGGESRASCVLGKVCKLGYSSNLVGRDGSFQSSSEKCSLLYHFKNLSFYWKVLCNFDHSVQGIWKFRMSRTV